MAGVPDYFGCPRPILYDELLKLGIPPERRFDLVLHTMYGLLDDLIPGSELCDKLLAEFDKSASEDYGEFFFYERKGHLVRFASRFWHRLALVIRNSTLLMDPLMEKGWGDIRDILEKAVVAVAGCSVGNSAIKAITGDLRPLRLKIADSKEYHLTNANRVALTYEDFGRIKSIVTAEQIHAVDPFMKVDVFSEGIHTGNLDEFVAGSSVIIEEMDDLRMKISIREKARALRIPVVMATDLGSAVQLDVRRFDVRPELPLASCTKSDDELYRALERCERDPNRSNFFAFVTAIVGGNDVYLPEYRRIVLRQTSPIFAGVPQLGSTVMAAGGLISEAVARLLLGHKLPERLFVHKFTSQAFMEGEML